MKKLVLHGLLALAFLPSIAAAQSSIQAQQITVSGQPLPTVLATKEVAANKGVANGYASLDGTAKVPAAQIPAPSASALGGVESYTAPAHQWLTGISTSGAPIASQPGCADLSNAAPSCATDTTNAANISSGILAPAHLPALSGDISTSAASAVTTLATVNATPGTVGSVSSVPVLTVDAKGRVTGVSSALLGSAAAQPTSAFDAAGSATAAQAAAISAANAAAPGLAPVQSVAGRTGAITLSPSDISGLAPSATTDTTNAANIISGILAAGRLPALTGDISSSAGSATTVLATVNSNPGTAGSSSTVPVLTTDAKGRVTAVSTVAVTPSAIGAATTGALSSEVSRATAAEAAITTTSIGAATTGALATETSRATAAEGAASSAAAAAQATANGALPAAGGSLTGAVYSTSKNAFRVSPTLDYTACGTYSASFIVAVGATQVCNPQSNVLVLPAGDRFDGIGVWLENNGPGEMHGINVQGDCGPNGTNTSECFQAFSASVLVESSGTSKPFRSAVRGALGSTGIIEGLESSYTPSSTQGFTVGINSQLDFGSANGIGIAFQATLSDPPFSTTTSATTASGSNVLTVTSASGIVTNNTTTGDVTNWVVMGLSAYFPAGTYVTAVSGTSVTLSNAATALVPASTPVTFGTGDKYGTVFTQDMPTSVDWLHATTDCGMGTAAGVAANVIRINSISSLGSLILSQVDCQGRWRSTNGVYAGADYSHGVYIAPGGVVGRLEATGDMQLQAGTSTGNAYINAPGAGANVYIRTASTNIMTANITQFSLSRPLKLPSYTVSTLPSCNATYLDDEVVVSDAASPTYLGSLTGSGTTTVTAVCNGTSWLAH